MAIIPGSVPITGFVAPTDDTDVYPSHDEKYGKGGYQSVVDATARLAITAARRKEGQLVYQIDTAILYQLQSDLVTWLPFTGGGATTTLTGDVTGSGSGSIATTLATVIVAATKGSATKSPTIQVNAKGLVISISDQDIQILISQVTGLVAALAAKVDDSEVGSTIATLVAGLVPLSQLPFGAIAYQGLYNATTNTPAILNGVGTAGDFYIANVIGNAYAPVNVTIVNQIVAYDGAVWQVGAVFGGGIQQIVTDNGTLSGGTVTMDDTTYFAPSTGRQYQTDLQKAAADAAEAAGASGADRYAILSDLGSMVVGTAFLTPEDIAATADAAYILGNGTAQTFASYGKTLGQAQADFPLAPITATSDLVDWAAIYQASKMMESGSRQNQVDLGLYGAREYRVNKPIELAALTSKRSQKFIYDLHGSCIRSTTNANVFQSVPSTQVIADTWISREISIRNGQIEGGYGAKGNGQCGIRIGASVEFELYKIEIAGCDVSVDAMFCLFMKATQCRSTNAATNGYWIHCGLSATGVPAWTNAGLSNSASNSVTIDTCRGLVGLQSDYGLYAQAVSGLTLINYVSEGTEFNPGLGELPTIQPKAGIFFDDMGSTVTKGFNIFVMHAEQSYTDSLIKIKMRNGLVEIDDLYNHKVGLYSGANRVIWNAESTLGEVFLNLARFRYATQYQQFGLPNITSRDYVRPDFTRCELNGNPVSRADLQGNAAMWSNQVPTYVSITPLLRS